MKRNEKKIEVKTLKESGDSADLIYIYFKSIHYNFSQKSH